MSHQILEKQTESSGIDLTASNWSDHIALGTPEEEASLQQSIHSDPKNRLTLEIECSKREIENQKAFIENWRRK